MEVVFQVTTATLDGRFRLQQLIGRYDRNRATDAFETITARRFVEVFD